jgi:hypothetical protein
MTTPTSFSLSATIAVCDILTFANGMDLILPQSTQNTLNLLGFSTKGYVLPDNVVGYLLGSYQQATGVFTVGDGTQTLFWNGTSDEFTSVGKTGGNWQLAT